VQTRKSSKNKKWLLLSCRLLLSLLSSLCATLFCSKDKENATNEMYIILDNSFMQAKGKQGELLKRAVQEPEETPENTTFLY
jgi:hypothetical protein